MSNKDVQRIFKKEENEKFDKVCKINNNGRVADIVETK